MGKMFIQWDLSIIVIPATAAYIVIVRKVKLHNEILPLIDKTTV